MAHLITYRSDYQDRVEAFFEHVRAGTAFPFEPEGSHADLRQIPSIYQSTGGQFWLLLDANVLIGTIALKALTPEVAEIKRLQLLEEYQGRGFGTQLFSIAMQHAGSQGFASVRLDSNRENGPALSLYEKFGFQEIGRYNDNPHVDIFMELHLDGMA